MTFLKYLYCLIFMCSMSSMVNAAHHRIDIVTEASLQQKLEQKGANVKKYIVSKRIKKKRKSEEERISNGAIITLLAGLLTVSIFIFAIYANLVIFAFILIATAIVSGIFGIRTLRIINRSDSPSNYRFSKIMTIIGLIPFLVLSIFFTIGLIASLLY